LNATVRFDARFRGKIGCRRYPDAAPTLTPHGTQEAQTMVAYDFTMSLGLRHPDIDPARITQALALEPDHVWQRGDRRVDVNGAPLEGAHHDSYWVADFVRSSALAGEQSDVEGELSRLLQSLRKAMEFMQGLRHGGGAAELFITIYARGDFRLSLLADEASVLGRLGITMTVEVRPYPAASAPSRRRE
jgi:hypothetical protein